MAIVVASSRLLAQSPDEFEVAIKFDQGRFISDRATAQLTLSERYSGLLRPGVTRSQLIAEFCDALDREFRMMPKVYFFGLTDAEKAKDLQNTLEGAEFETLRNWNGTIADFPRLQIFLEDRTIDFDPRLKQVTQRSALGEWVNEDNHQINRPFRFRVRDPLMVAQLRIPRTGALLTEARVRDILRPLDRLPANPGRIQDLLLDFYTPRGITPKIDVRLDASPPELSIIDTSRIARLLLPADLKDPSLAGQIAYNALPNRAFKAFRARSAVVLAGALSEEATKREIDLTALVAAAEEKNPPLRFELPPVDAAVLTDVQFRLIQIGFTASLYEHDPANQLLDLVIDAATTQPGAAAASNAVTATSETPPSAPAVSARPNAGGIAPPDPIIPAPKMPRRPDNTPRRDQKNFLGGGVEYRPGQGVRALGSYQRRNTFGQDLISIQAGGMHEGFGSGQYSRDYVLFDALGRRLGIELNGGSNFERQRVLAGVLTDERRTGAALGLNLEVFRDGPGHQVDLRVEGRRESVTLTPVGTADAAHDGQTSRLTAVDVGVAYKWRRSLISHPVSLRIEPALRLGLPLDGEPRFGRLRLGTQYHQTIAGPVQVESRFEWRRATARTPIFEQPSLGGQESVRGFRADERVGRRLWAWQNELWLPVLGRGARSRFRDFVRANVRLAALYDLGRAAAPASDLGESFEFRHGAGMGLRVRYQGVVIEADWAYGFGNDQARRPGQGRFHFNFRLP